ncbi:MAG: FadR/GntR family transcriptional regulator [Spirochaetia bacterium]|jgi:GntR family transcriptional repressor for pyruvate dehydrogenase complex|nr:FadR/GntR family transcriptional regulator [Spirochaetia bacterium]
MKILMDDIIEYLQSDKISAGEKIPSERQLSSLFNCSRGEVRKALKQLEFEQMVKIVPQVGAVLTSKVPGASMLKKILNISSIDISSLLELRVVLEISAAGLAAQRATDEDIKAIQDACLAYEKEATEFKPWHEENKKFHNAIIKASKNGAIISIMENLLSETAVFTRSRQSEYTIERLNSSIQEHKKIVQAIKNSDVNKAREEMTHHLKKMSEMIEKLRVVLA